jgi:methylated-DNA-protein-cysteine methyltransferase-like protein
MFQALLKAVRKIPKGKVATYGQVARAAGFPGAARQVAWALRSPAARGCQWHRVVAADGRIALPGEAGLEQRLRLRSEGVLFLGDRVRMEEHQSRLYDAAVKNKKKTTVGRKRAVRTG